MTQSIQDKRLFDGIRNSDIAKIDMALLAGADVNGRDHFNRTPLFFAAEYSTPEIMQHLIEAGADVNARDLSTGYSLLEYAAMDDMVEIIEMLIKAGADVDAKDKNGDTALDVAKAEHAEGAVKALEASYAPREYRCSIHPAPPTIITAATAVEAKKTFIEKLRTNGANDEYIDRIGHRIRIREIRA